MKCIVIEDQPPAQRLLKRYIDDIERLQLTGIFSDAIKALDFLQTNDVELIFLDIHLPKISGLDFLRSLHKQPQVILTTAFPDYALESYEFNVVDYLLKPYSFQRFVKAVAKVESKQIESSSEKDYGAADSDIYIKSGHEFIKVSIQDIVYINSDTDYTEVKTGHRKILSSDSLKYWTEALPPQIFARIHRSYILNTEMIDKVSGSQIHLKNGEILPIGRAYKESFFKNFIKGLED